MEHGVAVAEKFGHTTKTSGNIITVSFPEGSLDVERTESGWVTHQGQFDDIEIAYQHFSPQFAKQWQEHMVQEINSRFT